MDDEELEEELEEEETEVDDAQVEYDDQEYGLHDATITETGTAKVESVTVGGSVLIEKAFKSKWFYIGAATFLGCFYVFVIIIAFLVKTTDGMEYAIDKMDENEKYTQIYKAVEEVEKSIQSEYGVSVNKYLIISALTVFMNNHYYQNNSSGAFNYVNVESDDGTKSTTVIKNFAEILAKYQIVNNSSCDMPSDNYREIASNDDDGMTYFTTSASAKEKNYDCNGEGGSYKVSYKQGVLDDEESGSAFYWNMLDENFFNNYYPEYFGNLTKNGDNPDQYYKAADEVLDFIYLYARYLKSLDTRANSCNENNYGTIYKECKGVTVLANSSGQYGGTYSLEDYVAGVVNAEAPPTYISMNLPGGLKANEEVVKEATKAFAIAIRSYTINRTNGCQNTIRNSDQDQVFKPTNDPFITSIVKETEGLVITNNGEIISAEYDSFCGGSSSCRASHCNSERNCNYQKIPSSETHEVSIPLSWKGIAGGHGRGMSQWANVWYSYDKKWKFEETLKFFYADTIEIKRLSNTSGESSSGLTCSSSGGGTQAKDFNALGDRAYNGDKAAQQEWIEKVGKIVQNAQHSKYGIKNSLIIAQLIQESGWMHTPKTKNSDGNTLTNSCNNVLGINYDMGKKISDQTSAWSKNPQKCANSSVTQWDSNGNVIGTVEDMRKYNSLEDCIEDYANLVYLYHPECKNNNDIECYRSFLQGYTPNPNRSTCDFYKSVIEMYNLDRFDQ